MNFTNRNSLIVILVGSSILLLIVLQFFWLRSAYRDAADQLRSETSALFRTTIFALQDSLIQKNILPVDGDSTDKYFQHKQLRLRGLPPFDPPPDGEDSVISYFNVDKHDARIEVFVSTNEGDSVSKILRPLINKIQGEKNPARFIIRLGPDSLNKDSIRKEYSVKLAEAGIDLPFTIYSFKTERRQKSTKTFHGSLLTDVVRVNPMQEYAVSFSKMKGYLIARITPQIFFSTFLTLLTIGAFYVMHRSLRSQQKLMALKNDFISNVTHELKTPVATVSVALEALRNFNALNDPRRTLEYLEIAQNELDRLTLMTDKILKTSVFESKGIALTLEEIDLEELVAQVVSSLRLIFEKRKIKCDVEKSGKDFSMKGSEAHLTNVLYNLLDNALKYSSDGSQIIVRLTKTDSDILLCVIDNGMGIPAEYHRKIFEKFFRVPSGDIHNTKGYGLGLSYVAGVVQSHHGSIDVQSEPGNGSQFLITLPRA
jgi:two-component system, OmpR family, phosphate regulon sensor histidine kinase PhoR